MASQSLYRKHRPQHFSDLIGQEHVTTALRNASKVVLPRSGTNYPDSTYEVTKGIPSRAETVNVRFSLISSCPTHENGSETP